MQIPPGFVAIFVRFTNATGHACQNVIGWEVADNPTQAQVNTISNNIGPTYRAQLNTSGTYDGLHVLVGSDGDPGVVESTTGSGVGTRTGALLTPQVQGLLKKRTLLSGRKNRGRGFIPDMFESQVDDSGNVNSTARALLDAIGSLQIGLQVLDAVWVRPVILHNDSTDPTSIVEYSSDPKVATLRRRYERV
jgi:hypothetical protein